MNQVTMSQIRNVKLSQRMRHSALEMRHLRTGRGMKGENWEVVTTIPNLKPLLYLYLHFFVSVFAFVQSASVLKGRVWMQLENSFGMWISCILSAAASAASDWSTSRGVSTNQRRGFARTGLAGFLVQAVRQSQQSSAQACAQSVENQPRANYC